MALKKPVKLQCGQVRGSVTQDVCGEAGRQAGRGHAGPCSHSKKFESILRTMGSQW